MWILIFSSLLSSPTNFKDFLKYSNVITAWNVSVFGVFLVRIFLYSHYLSIFSPNAGKYGPENSEYGQILRTALLLKKAEDAKDVKNQQDSITMFDMNSNRFQSLTISAKLSILGVWLVLKKPTYFAFFFEESKY